MTGARDYSLNMENNREAEMKTTATVHGNEVRWNALDGTKMRKRFRSMVDALAFAKENFDSHTIQTGK
jgi:hypothetical protein